MKKQKKDLARYGELYGKFLEGEIGKKKPERKNWYISFCRGAGKIIHGSDKFKKEDYRFALDFLGWNLTPRQVNAGAVLALLMSLLVCLPILGYILYAVFVTHILPFTILMYTALPLILVPFFITWYVQSYLLRAANIEKMRSITYISEIVNYLVMSMKLTSNLEKAVEFAGEHGRGKIADDFRNLTWDIRIGVYRTVEEGLDKLAYRWGKYSEEFKHAMMLIRSSVIEVDETKRHLILDKAVTDVLNGIRDSMDKYAAEMRQPSIYLYYVGVLLPLMLIIILPIGSMMANLPIAQTWILILLYNILIPVGTVLFARAILKKRPPVYIPPKIPDTYPGLPPKGHIRLGKKTTIPAVLIAIFAMIATYVAFAYFLEPTLNPFPPSWNTAAQEAHFPFFQMTGVVLAVCFGISIFLYGRAAAKRRVQKQVMAMEREFQDSIYVLASRLGENRPVEEAVAYAADFLKGTKVAEVYRKTSDNITSLGMTIESALFDPIYGALKDNPSNMIKGSMRIVIDSINLGVQQAARALISLSMQLHDSQKIREKISSLLGEITAMMKSIAFLIAPLVLGITSALQQIVVSALSAVGTMGVAEAEITGPAFVGVSIPKLPLSSLGNPEMLEAIPSPLVFMIIMAIYVAEITLILVYFTSKIEEGENDLALKINIARSLPIAMMLFFLAAWFASQLTTVIT